MARAAATFPAPLAVEQSAYNQAEDTVMCFLRRFLSLFLFYLSFLSRLDIRNPRVLALENWLSVLLYTTFSYHLKKIYLSNFSHRVRIDY